MSRRRLPAAAFALIVGLGPLVAVPAVAAPRVVASIVPVHSLVAGVMAGFGAPDVVVRGYGSPHTYQMRPSDAAKLARADVVFWVGRSMETFLQRYIAGLREGGARVVELGALDGLLRLPNRAGGLVDERRRHDDDHAAEHAPGAFDAHLWLDVDNAKIMVRAIARELAATDAANADAYRANGEMLVRRLDELDRELAEMLRPVGDRPFVVFHDAYRYLEHRYDLENVGSVTVSPDRMPSARRIDELRERMAALGVRCVFREPQFESALVRTIAEASGARVAVLDPTGSTREPGPQAYFALMRANAEAIVDCLSR